MSRVVKNAEKKRIFISFPSASTIENDEASQKKLRVGAYCRVSSDSDEQLQSYNAQLEHYRDYLSNHKEYVFAGIYADEGVSGTGIKKREGFLRMLDDCRSRKLDMIITKSVSRFGRNTVDFLNVVRELKELGIDILFEKENIHSLNSEGEVLLTLMMAVAEAEAYNMSENIRWGKQRKYEKGSITALSGLAPYGFNRTENGFVIDEEKAEIIRNIYSMYLDGYGTGQIAKLLNEKNVPSFVGGSWSTAGVKNVLENEKYKGDICFRKTYICDPLTQKCVKNSGEYDRYYVKNAHKSIIDKEIWECVQLEIKRRNEYQQAHHVILTNSKGELYPFTGKLICAECGYSFLLKNTNRIEDNGIPRWRCGSFYKLRGKVDRSSFTCHSLWIEQGMPEKAFIQAWNSLTKITYDEETDVLRKYRIQQFNKLLEEYGQITEALFEMILKTLDHIVITPDGIMTVKFLSGVEVNIMTYSR